MPVNYESIEIELTTRCNASCPQCSRNYFGGKVWPSLPMVDLTLDFLKEKFSKQFLSTLKTVELIGTYCDPCIHKDLISIVNWLHDSTNASVFISTNGSLRTVKWWQELGSILRPNDRVMFGIDGLEDTNHLYRRNTNFKKIICNLTAFNSAGGKSIWSYIVFRHNEHQIDKARQLSEQLNCHGFAVKPTGRFVNKQHEMVDKFPVMNSNKKIIYWLHPPTNSEYVNPGYQNYKKSSNQFDGYNNYLKTVNICCDSKQRKYFAVSAQGYVFPCHWLYDRMYGAEVEDHPDRQRLLDLIDISGGLDTINLHTTPLDNILNGKFFKNLEDSWTDDRRIDRCANQCGVDNLFASSYDNINKLL